LTKNEPGLAWSSSTIQKVHRSVGNDMKKQIPLRIIGERFEDTWIDGVELSAKSLLNYLIPRYGLEKKAKTVDVEVFITCDSAKLDDMFCHMTAWWKITDKDTRDPLIIDQEDFMKICRLVFDTIQSERN
jgi:hypothetical protein